jgi:hypothetical protein
MRNEQFMALLYATTRQHLQHLFPGRHCLFRFFSQSPSSSLARVSFRDLFPPFTFSKSSAPTPRHLEGCWWTGVAGMGPRCQWGRWSMPLCLLLRARGRQAGMGGVQSSSFAAIAKVLILASFLLPPPGCSCCRVLFVTLMHGGGGWSMDSAPTRSSERVRSCSIVHAADCHPSGATCVPFKAPCVPLIFLASLNAALFVFCFVYYLFSVIIVSMYHLVMLIAAVTIFLIRRRWSMYIMPAQVRTWYLNHACHRYLDFLSSSSTEMHGKRCAMQH